MASLARRRKDNNERHVAACWRREDTWRYPEGMSLLQLTKRFALRMLTAVWLASCTGEGETNADPPLTEGEGSEGGEGGTDAGSGGSTAGQGGGGAGGSFPGTGGSFPAGGSAGVGGSFPGTGGNAGSGGGPAAGEFGAKCTGPNDCNSKTCVEVGNSKSLLQICSQACSESTPCPAGAHCVNLDPLGPLCVPDRESPCSVCSKDTDCRNKGDRCLASGTGQTYCAQDCSVDSSCPAGYECKAPPGALQGTKVCTLLPNTECPCAPNRDKTQRPCTKKIGDKVCGGFEVCNGSVGAYEGCSAPDPAPEVCDGKDNDCDGKTDNPTNATCQCSGDTCTIQCQAGFVRYPPTLPESEGCPCMLDAGEPEKGSTCATALNITEIADVGGKDSVSISGTISADDDVDWYKISIKDNPEANTNTYHARISFEANPDNEFVFWVLRGANCAQEGAAPPLTSYELCVNFQQNVGGVFKGLKTCAPNQPNVPQCQNMSAIYLIKVSRNAAAATKSCSKYTLKFQANAGPCDEASFDACGEQFGPKLP
jgi:hypothetical protein